MRLNVGCGGQTDPLPCVINVDIVRAPGVDVLADLDQGWPFRDECATSVLASQVFEHLEKPVEFIAEAWRVLALGGVLLILTPYWQHENSATDPTHRRASTLRTFDYWVPGTALHSQFGEFYAGRHTFEKIAVDLVGGDIRAELRKVVA